MKSIITLEHNPMRRSCVTPTTNDKDLFHLYELNQPRFPFPTFFNSNKNIKNENLLNRLQFPEVCECLNERCSSCFVYVACLLEALQTRIHNYFPFSDFGWQWIIMMEGLERNHFVLRQHHLAIFIYKISSTKSFYLCLEW